MASNSSWDPSTWFAANTTDDNGTFSVLASGTQDLAALVALFVTESVERFLHLIATTVFLQLLSVHARSLVY